MTPRRPHFARIILTGAIIGLLVGGFIGTGVLEDETATASPYVYGSMSGIGIMGLFFAGLFAIVAAVIAVLLDRRNP